MQKKTYQECFSMTYFASVVGYPGNLGQRISPPCGRANTNVLGADIFRYCPSIQLVLALLPGYPTTEAK